MKQNYKDFRCGNLVEFEGEVYEIYGISEEYPFLNTINFGVGVVTWENIKPIELTRDVLLNMLGFSVTNNEREYYFSDDELNVYFLFMFYKNGRVDCSFAGMVYKNETRETMPLKYVHTIQNVFHSLTNREFTIHQ